MSTESKIAPPLRRSSATPLVLGLSLAAILASCGSQAVPLPVGVPGEEQTIPGAPGDPPINFIVDNNLGGGATQFFVTGIFWGRLVDVYDRDLLGVESLQYPDFLISHLIQDGEDFNFDQVSDFELSTDVITGRERLTVLAARDTPEWKAAIAWLNDVDNLTPIEDKSLAVNEVPPFPFIARNSAMMLRFNDLIAPGSANAETVRLRSGYPPVVPFESRIFEDRNHGTAIEGPAGPEFRSTRVIVDMTVSTFESLLTGQSVNELGLPASTGLAQANTALHIPTVLDFAVGQFELLRNIVGNSVDTTLSGSSAPTSATNDVVRALRSGGNTQVTNDAFNGFLPDFTPPRLISRQPIFFLNTPPPLEVAPGEWVISYVYLNLNCAITPQPGDIVRWTSAAGSLPLFGEVTGNTTPPVNGVATDVRITLIDSGTTQVPTGNANGEFLTNYDPSDSGQAQCFMRTSPLAGAPPNEIVDPSASFLVEFSEAMNPESMRPFDSVMLTSNADGNGEYLAPTGPEDYVAAKVTGQGDKRVFVSTPVLPLSHDVLVIESYFLNLVPSNTGLTDLAGNELQLQPPPIKIRLDPLAPTQRTGNYVLRFSQEDEDQNSPDPIADPWPEIRGQFTRDTAMGVIRPRPVTRFAGTIDRTSQNPDSLMSGAETWPNASGASPFDVGIAEPLIRYGSRIMGTWRADDMELKVNSEALYNIDVEAMSWVPLGGGSQVDTFPNFQISLAHSFFAPDGGIEDFNFAGLGIAIAYPNSGLKTSSWNENILPEGFGSPQMSVVHSGGKGYIIDPSKGFQTPAETFMQPFPLNDGVSVADKTFYTWRDTSIVSLGGDITTLDALNTDVILPMLMCPGVHLLEHLNNGVGTLIGAQFCNGTITDATDLSTWVHGPGVVGRAPGLPSVLLPLLMDFQTAVSPGSLAQNLFDASDISSPSTFGAFGLPTTRLIASGGQDASGIVQNKPPQLQSVPNGGFNPNPAWTGGLGAPTPSSDSLVYLGQADFVIRISRAHTVWIPAGSANAKFVPPVVEYLTGSPPLGTGVEVHFRGALSVPTNPNQQNASTDANRLNSYGDEPVNPFTYEPVDPTTLMPRTIMIDPLADTEDLYYANYGDIFIDGSLNNNIAFFDNPSGQTGFWYEDPSDIDNVQFFQARVTFISNAASLQSPELSALGFTWFK